MFLRSAEKESSCDVVFVGEVCEKLKEGLSKNLTGILLLLEMKLYMDYGS
jgi:hypothetical protein